MISAMKLKFAPRLTKLTLSTKSTMAQSDSSICLECIRSGDHQPLPPVKDQSPGIMLFVQILIDWSLTHATDDQFSAIQCTPAWRARVFEALQAAVAGTIDRACSTCGRPHALAVMSYVFNASYEAVSWMPLRDEVRRLALDNIELQHVMCVHACPVKSLIAARQGQ